MGGEAVDACVHLYYKTKIGATRVDTWTQVTHSIQRVTRHAARESATAHVQGHSFLSETRDSRAAQVTCTTRMERATKLGGASRRGSPARLSPINKW